MPVSVLSVYCKPRFPFITAMLLALAVAGCGNATTNDKDTITWSEPGSEATVGTTPPSVPSVVPVGPATASGPSLNWQASLAGDIVTVELRDANNHYRVEQVELVGPNGITVAASDINRETNRASGNFRSYGGGPSVGVGGWGGSRGGGGFGVGLGFPLGGRSTTDRQPPPGTITTARVRLPDPAFYRQTVENWIIRVTTTDHGNQSSVAVIPAPKPNT